MRAAHVVAQRAAQLVGGAARGARERRQVGVQRQVRGELVARGEGAAAGAAVRALAGVAPRVPREAGAQTEGGAAVGAGERAARGVRAAMRVQRAALREPLAALAALEGPLAGVRAQVLAQVLLVGEGAAAQAAGAAAQALVRLGHVAREALRRAEPLPAHVAHLRPLAGVDPRVMHECVRGGEPTSADAARVERPSIFAQPGFV